MGKPNKSETERKLNDAKAEVARLEAIMREAESREDEARRKYFSAEMELGKARGELEAARVIVGILQSIVAVLE